MRCPDCGRDLDDPVEGALHRADTCVSRWNDTLWVQPLREPGAVRSQATLRLMVQAGEHATEIVRRHNAAYRQRHAGDQGLLG